MFTVRELRKRGYKVTVHHSRYISPEFGGKKRGELVNALTPDLTPKMFDPRGGVTEVTITGQNKYGVFAFVTKSKCRKDENYNRKVGVKVALNRVEKFFSEGL